MARKIEKDYMIAAPPAKVWSALTVPAEIEAWGAGPGVEMDARAESQFSLWGGSIYGRNTEVEPEKLLVQEWYGGDWPEPSRVTFRLRDQGAKTALVLEQTGVPEAEVKDINAGWDTEYLGPLREYVEAGATD